MHLRLASAEGGGLTPTGTSPSSTPEPFDALALPGIGAFLKWPHSRKILQLPLLALAVLMIWHGFAGPDLAPRNAATVLSWVHYRGFLLAGLLVAGNVFCMACPFMLPRNLARKFIRPVLHWPAPLRNKWLAVVILAAFFFCYEAFDLWASPWLTAWIIVGYFGLALLIDSVFTNASFCKYVCPIGQFNFTASTVSPLELQVRDHDVCASCQTRDCIKGRRDPVDPSIVVQRGCELALFQPKKIGNMDCTLCLDCVYACPHDNIGLRARLPASELWEDPHRSGVGHFGSRPDLAFFAVVFTFAALLNAFGMVSPVHTVQAWLSDLMGTTAEWPALTALFGVVLVVEPVVLLGGAAAVTRAVTPERGSLLSVATRFAYALVPLGLSMWAAHHAFHLLSGVLTIIPVLQEAMMQLGVGLFGEPLWGLRGVPPGLVTPTEWGLLGLGGLGSLMVARKIAEREYGRDAGAAFVPWAALVVILWISSIWLLQQPMEMRGMMMGN